jgi:hypothetical protein
MPRLYHLSPPFSRLPVVVTRFAPLYENTGLFGIQTRPRHDPCYDVIFSSEFIQRTKFDLDNYAYLFDRYYKIAPGLPPLYDALDHIVDHWKKEHLKREVLLSYAVNGSVVSLRDSRFDTPRELDLDEVQSRVYLACDAVQTSGLEPARLDEAIQQLDEERLIWRENDMVLGLAIPEAVVDDHRQSNWVRHWPSIYAN